MPKLLTEEQKRNSLNITKLAQLVEGTFNTPELVNVIKSVADEHQQLTSQKHQEILQELSKLCNVIASKEFENKELKLVAQAVISMTQQMLACSAPVAYRIDFERDQRGFMKTGVTLTPQQVMS